nr:amidohydrolase [Bacteroidota bacterium]
MKEKVKQKSEQLFEEIRTHRRHLHMHPELSYHEHNTSEYVQAQLAASGINFQNGIADTGIVALIEGKNPTKKVIALRGDMDALPINETNDVIYKSQNPGVMHACGHDVHTSCLLGAAKILHSMRHEFEGTIKCIFQPAEEKLPGGASIMIKEGVLQNPKPNCIIGQHVMPLIETGKVGFRSGVYMASTDELYMRVKGKGGHGAMPHLNIDPVVITSHIIIALQQIVSRTANPTMPSVLSFGKVIANGATNVIPDEVYVEGTFRTLDETWRTTAHTHMTKMVHGIAESMGAKVEFEIRKGYPVLYNEPQITARTRNYATDYLGQENIVDLDIWMAAEDFAYYTQVTDGCFYRLGTRNEARGITSSVHTPTFDVDEDSLKIGVGLMAYIALRELSV